LKAWPVVGILLVQAFLLLAHWFIYHTWIAFWPLGPAAALRLGAALLLLAFSFIIAALLSYRFSNPLVALIYKIAAVWLGFLNYIFWAACLSWLAWFAMLLSGLHANPAHVRPLIFAALCALAVVTGIYGLLNARRIRIRRVAVKLPNLPASWRGRTALVLSDLHLGNVNGLRFCRRMTAMASRLRPDIAFLPGDIFDGMKTDPDRLAAPFKELRPPLGVYFSTGNHEEYGDEAHGLEALNRVGVRALMNEKETVDGLIIAGVTYSDSTYPIRLRATLEGLSLEPAQASILLNHMPSRLPIVEQAGVSLQISGHTHCGQLFPYTWFTRRVFGKFTYGLQRFGALQVYTSSGAGTWGPPMRVGTSAEMVLLRFE
jgi:hypothetical protein